uniref:Uncharacterized protein n=1 Tax=Arundo donax TaxID=35708 RepID=A0A0A9BC86_ARUDO
MSDILLPQEEQGGDVNFSSRLINPSTWAPSCTFPLKFLNWFPLSLHPF